MTADADRKHSRRGLLVVSASAGSGKTHRLTQEVIAAVDPSASAAIPLDGLVAVTYTRKAATELSSRIRRRLQGHAVGLSPDFGLAHIGTVHAVCLRLIKDFAFEAGVSPSVDVLPDDEGRLLREVLEREMPIELHEQMTTLSESLQIRWDSRVRRHDWVTPVEDIMTLARSNRIAPQELDAMAERSLNGLLALLPPDIAEGDVMDSTLDRELRAAILELERIDDGQQNTAEALEQMRAVSRHHPLSSLPWNEWARLSRLTPGKSCRPVIAKVVETAAQYERHPRLRNEIRQFVEGAFRAARIGLERFADWKARRRVLDYVDMIDRALDLIGQSTVREELAHRLRLVVVDEFQDTSPIQLALFAGLHRLAGQSVWVGDRKQCIFEYAGADPILMDAAIQWCRDSEGTVEPLRSNFRSRRELVEAACALFTSAFDPYGVAADEVAVSAQRVTPPVLEALPPLGIWWIEAARNEDEARAMAVGVAKLISHPRDTIVVDRESDTARPVRPGDIAVLVATNDEASALAKALEEAGVRAILPRQGLLKTPEGMLMISALEYLHDRSATLACATIEALLGFDGLHPNRWLERLLSRADSQERSEPGATIDEEVATHSLSAGDASLLIGRLDAVRSRVEVLAPSEVVDCVIAEIDIARVCARWPDAPQRLGNIDAFRGLVRKYEQRCLQENEAASLAGLLRHFRIVSTPSLRRDDLRAADDQHVRTGDDAVTVCTYHRAKGLEWPVVVMASLNRPARRGPFEVYPETDRLKFDPDAPLADRWIRYWPWPFGSQKDVPLANVAAQSSVGLRVAQNERYERVRLLYVGFTRARDHLILAARSGKNGPRIQWLDELKDSNGRALLQLPWDSASGYHVEIRRQAEEALRVPARVWRLSADADEGPVSSGESPRWFSRPPVSAKRPRFWIAPSRAAQEWPECGTTRIGEVLRLGDGAAGGLNLPSDEWPRLGTAVHGFLAADHEGLAPSERLIRARRLLAAAELSSTVKPEALLEASDALLAFIGARWPASRIHREVPIQGSIAGASGKRGVRGAIDMLIETTGGLVVIDHKTFPAIGEAAWRAKAEEYGPQILAYTRVLGMVPGMTVAPGWIHFVLSGALVQILPTEHPAKSLPPKIDDSGRIALLSDSG